MESLLWPRLPKKKEVRNSQAENVSLWQINLGRQAQMTKLAKLLEEDRYQDQPRLVNIRILLALHVPIDIKLTENFLTSSCRSISQRFGPAALPEPFQTDTWELGDGYPETIQNHPEASGTHSIARCPDRTVQGKQELFAMQLSALFATPVPESLSCVQCSTWARDPWCLCRCAGQDSSHKVTFFTIIKSSRSSLMRNYGISKFGTQESVKSGRFQL